MSILIALTPSESKRLIGKAVAVHPLVNKAMSDGNIFISNGSTTGYVIEELLQTTIDIYKFPCGVITKGVLCKTPEDRLPSMLIKRGEVQECDETLSELEQLQENVIQLNSRDVYIKGANAMDSHGNAGFLLARPNGGNIMHTLHQVCTQGVNFIIPTGLEKLIASIPDAQKHMKGINAYTYTFGKGCGYVSVNNGIIIDEIVSLRLLTGVHATHVASGGIGGSEGSVVLDIEGTEAQEEVAVRLLKTIKGEPVVPAWKMKCTDCSFKCKYQFSR